MVELNKDLLIDIFGYKLDQEAIMLTSENIIKIDSNAFKEFTELEYLSLSDNQIEQLEEALFESQSKLEVLCICDNRLKQIQTNTFKGLTQLETLKLSKNQLTTIDANSFIDLSNLNELCLSKNKLERIVSDAFKGLVNLETLKLNNNQIEVIQEGSFNGLSNLRDLHLENNKLKIIGANVFGNLNKLETLLLDHNELESIDFNGLSNLKELHLESNKLERVKRSSFEHLKSIKLIRLDDTKFKLFSFLDNDDKEYYSKYSNTLKKIGFLTDWNSFLGQFQTTFKDFHNLRLLIVDYYDSLISDIDIYTEELLESTKVQEFRTKAIEEINKVKYETLERYESNKEKYQFDRNELTDEKLESIRSELFEEKFCFLLRINNKKDEFNLIKVVCDFYLNQFDLNLIKSLIQRHLKFRYKDLLVLSFLLGYIIRESSNKVVSISRQTLGKIRHINIEDNFDFDRVKSLCYKFQSDELIKSKSLGTVFKNLEYLSVFDELESIEFKKSDEKTHVCDICEMRFKKESQLEEHKRAHTEKRPFECDICKKSFMESGFLELHRNTHIGEN